MQSKTCHLKRRMDRSCRIGSTSSIRQLPFRRKHPGTVHILPTPFRQMCAASDTLKAVNASSATDDISWENYVGSFVETFKLKCSKFLRA
jgi:hypothetical protein